MGIFEYNQAFNVGEAIISIGALVMVLVLSYILFRLYNKLCNYIDMIFNREAKYDILEESCLDTIAKDKGIDLDKELRKRNMIKKPSRSFRKKIEDQVYEEMFGKEEPEPKSK